MTARPIEVGATLGEYQITGRLGSGAAGTVFRAKCLTNGKEVALKVLTAAAVVNEDIHRRFIREIAIAQKLSHPNVVGYDYCGVDDDVLYYTMELVSWGALSDVLAENGPLPWREAVECGIEICRGLQHLHDSNIVHRDLKPANVFLSDDGRLKLGDFGLARDLDSFRLTVEGQTVGTVKYLAPEQAMGEAELDGRTDLYALGCILFEMVAGRTPFVADQPHSEFSAFQMMQKHVEQAPPKISDFAPGCPAPFVSLIDRLLAKQRDDRPESADEVAAELRRILEHPNGDATRQTPTEAGDAAEPKLLTERLRESRHPQQRINPRALVIVLVLVGIAIAAAVFSR